MRTRWRWMVVAGLLAAGAQAQEAAPAADGFRDALSSAYQTNPRLRAEREALKALDESVAEAYSGMRPNANAEFNKGRARRSVGAQDWGYYDTKVRSLTVEQPLYSGGEISARLRQTKARVKAGRAQLRAVEQQVLLDAITAYVDLAQNMAMLELSRKNVEVLTRHRDVTGARFDAGELTRTDMQQSEARRARAIAEMQQAEGDVAASRAGFVRVIGFEAPAVEMPEGAPRLPATLEEAKTRALEAFPQLKEAMFVEKAAGGEVDARGAQLLPSLTLRGTMNRTEGSSIPGVGSIDQDALTLNVAIPLYQGGGEYARLRAAKKRYQESRFDTVDVNAATIENATRAWHDYQASLAVITSSEVAVEAAQSAAEGVQEEYENGERTTLDVLDAEQEMFSNRVNLVKARRNKTVLAYGLLAATGGLNAQELALPVEIYDPIAHYDVVKWLPIGF